MPQREPNVIYLLHEEYRRWKQGVGGVCDNSGKSQKLQITFTRPVLSVQLNLCQSHDEKVTKIGKCKLYKEISTIFSRQTEMITLICYGKKYVSVLLI